MWKGASVAESAKDGILWLKIGSSAYAFGDGGGGLASCLRHEGGFDMSVQQVLIDSFSGMCAGMWLDGLDGQEDELDDVSKGKVQPEAGGEVVIRPNRDAVAQQHADEDEEMIEEDLETRLPG